MKKIELLAPAGDLEKLKIAIAYKADAIYIGGKNYSLRYRASNFTLDDIKEGVKFAHQHKKKLYVALNMIPHEEDLIGLDEYIRFLSEIEVDGIITASLAVINYLKNYKLDIHLSTQQSTFNSYTIKFWKSLGVKRVVLARELTIEQIEYIRSQTDIELEVFVHGGCCSSISGRCVLSNYMTNRDANRGGCAHSCRWNYNLYKNNTLLTKEYFTASSKDLMAISLINKLKDINIDCLKIEGRMKSLHYIATVVKAYHNAINGIDDDYYTQIKKAENRETSLNFLNNNPETIYDKRNERPQQLFVGIVKEYDERTHTVCVQVRNYFEANTKLEVLFSDKKSIIIDVGQLYSEDGNMILQANNPMSIVYFECKEMLYPNNLLRLIK